MFSVQRLIENLFLLTTGVLSLVRIIDMYD